MRRSTFDQRRAFSHIVQVGGETEFEDNDTNWKLANQSITITFMLDTRSRKFWRGKIGEVFRHVFQTFFSELDP